jgi:multidrug resistance efflux pump
MKIQFNYNFCLSQARKDVSNMQKELQAVQKQAASVESRIESKRSDRHNILRQCKVRHTLLYASLLSRDHIKKYRTDNVDIFCYVHFFV